MPTIIPSDYTNGKPNLYYAYAIYHPKEINLSGYDIASVFSESCIAIPISLDFSSTDEFIILEKSTNDKHILIDGKTAEPISDYKLWKTLGLAKEHKVITEKQWNRGMSSVLYSFALYIYAVGHKTKKMKKAETLDELKNKEYNLMCQLDEVQAQIREMKS